MSFNLGTAVGYLDLDTSKFKKGFNSALGDLKAFSNKTSSAGDRVYALGSAMNSVGSTLTKNVTVPLLGVGTIAVGVTSKFDSAMSQVAAVSGATGDDLSALRDKAKEMGAATKFSASEAADAMNYMAMAGWKTTDMLNGIEGIMNLAAASGEDLATTSDIVTDALTAFGLTAADSAHFADVLAAASSNANTNVSMMGETFKYCAPIAGSLGFSVEDTAEAIGLMANSGIKSTQAGTALRTIMTSLTGKVVIAGKAIGEVTIATSKADGSMRELSDILEDCREAFKGLSESEQAAAAESLVGKNAMSGFLALINAAPSDINKLSAAIDSCDGKSKEMAETMQDNLGGQLTILKSTLEGLAISIGELLMPTIRKLVSGLQGILTKINSLTDEQKQAIVNIALAVAAIGPLLSILGKLLMTVGKLPAILKSAKAGLVVLKGAIGSISGPVLAIIVLVVALIAAFVDLWKNNEEFRNKIIGIWTGITGAFSDFFSQITDRINALGFNFKDFGEVLTALWKGLCDLLGPYFIAVFNYIAIQIRTVLDVIIGIVDFFIAIFTGDWEGAWEAIKSIFMAVWNGIVDWFMNIVNLFGSLLDTICGWFGVDWKNSMESAGNGFKSVWQSVADFFVRIWNSIKDFFTGIIQSIWQKVKPLFDEIAGAFKMAWDVIELIWDYSKPFFAGIWEGIKAVFSVVGEWFKMIFTTAWEYIKMAWNVVVAWFTLLWENIKAVFSVVATWFKGVFNVAWEAIKATWNNVVNYFTMLWAGIKAVFAVVKGVLSGNFTDAWEAIKNLWDKVVNFFSGVWTGIKNVFGAVVNYFSSTFGSAWDAIKKVFSNFGSFFSNLWDIIKNTFVNLGTKIGNSISGAVKAGINGVIGMIEGTVNGFIGLINGAINLINTIPGVGIRKINRLSFPRLAKGAVLPPNNPFLAVVGDQTHGVNVEAPLSTIQTAVAEVIKDFAPVIVGWQEITVIVLREILQAVYEFGSIKRELQRLQSGNGNSPILEFRTNSGDLDYEKLAHCLADALRGAPVQPKVSVEMQDGDVYLDKERVGRSVAPVVSRVIVQG